MDTAFYTAEVRGSLLIELPKEASELHLLSGERVQVQLTRSFNAMEPAQDSGEADLTKTGTIVAVKQLKARGMLAGTSTVDEFLRRKHAETEREDAPHR